MNERYPQDELTGWHEDDGTIEQNVQKLKKEVVGHRIVGTYEDTWGFYLILENRKVVRLQGIQDCGAFTYLESFWKDPNAVDHVILGVDTTESYTVWHIYADFGDIMRLNVDWDCGNAFYYGYGFDIKVINE